MPYASEGTFREYLSLHATHSNHPVTLLSPHLYFQTEGGSLFPLKRRLDCVLMTCDPMLGNEDLPQAIKAFDEAHASSRVALAAVQGPVAQVLAERGYSVFKLGEEPWVELSDFKPRGNRGKGIRAARNQALRIGCEAGEWTTEAFHADRAEIEAVFEEWRGMSFLSMEGGILGTNPFADIPGRRFFWARREGRLEAVLVATPIRAGISYYLEDLVYRKDACRGAQELITLASMERLHQDGAKRVSLGLVLLRKPERSVLGTSSGGFWLEAARLLSRWFYNAEGQDLFRKRFQIAAWEPAYFAYRGPRAGRMNGLTLPWAAAALMASLEPLLQWEVFLPKNW